MSHRARRRRVLLALCERYLPHKGGAFNWVHEVCLRLPPARVLTGRLPGTPAGEVLDGVSVKRIRLRRFGVLRPESLFLYASLLGHAAVAAAAERPRAILAARVLPEGLIGVLLGSALRVPCIVLAHGEEISAFGAKRTGLARRAWTHEAKRRLLWRVYGGATHVVANSRFTADRLCEGGVPRDRVTIIHPGTDPTRFRPMGQRRAKALLALDGRKILLTVGRLSRRKGQDMVLRALPALLRRYGNLVYVIAGTGEYGPDLDRLAASLGVKEHVRFLGEVDQDELPRLYAAADIFLMPNRSLSGRDVEGFGIVFVEAGACGLPVIGGRSGGVPDAVRHGETGLLVDGNSPDAIVRAVTCLLEDGNLARRLGKAGRARACHELTWDRSAATIASLMDG